MENLPSVKQNSNKGLIATLVTAIILLIVAGIAFVYHDEVTGFFNPQQDTEEQVCGVDSTSEIAPTIQEILESREYFRESIRIDSVYLTMPSIVLIDILMQHGTSLSNGDIVKIYESNKSTYNKVLSGAVAQKFYEDSILKTPRDTLRRK